MLSCVHIFGSRSDLLSIFSFSKENKLRCLLTFSEKELPDHSFFSIFFCSVLFCFPIHTFLKADTSIGHVVLVTDSSLPSIYFVSIFLINLFFFLHSNIVDFFFKLFLSSGMIFLSYTYILYS